MRLRTSLVFILLLLGAGGLGIVAFTDDTGGTLTVNWMSSTARPTQLNHHPIVATRSNGQTYIAAPVSSVAGQRGNCTLVMLTGNGSIRWRYSIADSACAIHGFGDPTLVDFDGDERLEVLVPTTEEAAVPAPVLGDVNNDGQPEVIAVTEGGTVVVLDAQSGAELAAYTRKVPIWTHPTLAEIDEDDAMEILVRYSDGRVVALDYTS
jgi:hypothetical protein